MGDGAGYCFSACCPPSACAAAMAMLKDIDAEGGKFRLARLQGSASQLHKALVECETQLKGAGLPIELISSEASFVQHFRWLGDSSKGATVFSKAAKACAQRNVRVQVCSPLVCATETTLNA